MSFKDYLLSLPKRIRGTGYFPRIEFEGESECFGRETDGSYCVVTNGLSKDSVVYSVGLGEDISFDLDLIGGIGCKVHGFDPTPRSVEYVQAQHPPEEFVLHQCGMAAYDGEVSFNPPEDPSHVSHTMLERPETSGQALTVPVKRLKTIMQELGHTHVDVLKIDIEGAEYDVIDDIVQCGVFPGQILVEYHHRFPGIGLQKTIDSVNALRGAGYKVFAVAPTTGNEFSLIKTD